MSNELVEQNKMIISLLARQVFEEGEIKEIVTSRKKANLKKAYIQVYNACNGKNTVGELVKMMGVSIGTLSPILKDWERRGIIYNIGDEDKPMYAKIIILSD